MFFFYLVVYWKLIIFICSFLLFYGTIVILAKCPVIHKFIWICYLYKIESLGNKIKEEKERQPYYNFFKKKNCSIAFLLNFILGFCKGSYLIPFNLEISSRLYLFFSILIPGLRDKKRKWCKWKHNEKVAATKKIEDKLNSGSNISNLKNLILFFK